ncbi:MAG: Universal stress protein family, partial [Gemmatimonadota bacterium]
MYRSILVPLDGSTLAERALTIALPIAERHGATLVLVAVHEPVLPAVPSSGVALYDTALDTEERARLQRHLARMAARVRKHGPIICETVFREGRVVPTLLAVIRERRADLTVMCTTCARIISPSASCVRKRSTAATAASARAEPSSATTTRRPMGWPGGGIGTRPPRT